MYSANYQSSSSGEIGLIEAQYKHHSTKPHYHFQYHIGLVTAGEQVYHYNGNKHQVGPGFIQVMLPGQVHDSNTLKGQGFRSRIFSLEENWFTKLDREKFANYGTPSALHTIKDQRLYQELLKLHQFLGQEASFKLAADCLQVSLFNKLFERYGDVSDPRPLSIGVQQMSQLRDYLADNLSEKIGLTDLANLCELSESQLLRQFKRHVGLTPYAWLARFRLERAFEMLKAGKNSTEVAFKVGFYDQAHFVKAFKSAYGSTPSKII